MEKEGIIEDKFFDKDVQRSILISSLESYEIVKQEQIEISYGDLGENIIIDINPYSLKEGDKLYIGDSILEITQNCTICNSLAKVDKKIPKLLKSDRGIFAKTYKSGNININDDVKIVIS